MKNGLRSIDDILAFWFSERAQALWFEKSDDFDAEITATFEATHKAALAGDLDGWADTAEGALALMVLLDQFPRNMYRGSPRSFAADAKAREIARLSLKRGHDMAIDLDRRTFFYLPFEHSEDIGDQDLSVRLFRERSGRERNIEFAEAHRDVIRQFGRFPHRNKVLGRPNTPEEEKYLEGPDAGW
jgi:uncharacterized protein (DUF924 family)